MLKTISKFPLRVELLAIFLLVATIPLLVLSGLSSRKSTRALEEAIYEKLNAVQAAKKNEILELYKTIERDINSLATSQQVMSSIFMFDDYLETRSAIFKKDDGSFPLDPDQYPTVHRQPASFLLEFIQTFGYDDAVLINNKAQVYFTTLRIEGNIFDLPTEDYNKLVNEAKDKELTLNLEREPLKDTGLAKVWKKVLETKKKAYQDISFYEPDNRKVLFVGAPIFEEGGDNIINVIVLKILSERFDAIMKERTGMGKTGIFLLLGKSETGEIGFRNNISLKTDTGIEKYVNGEKAEEKYFSAVFTETENQRGIYEDSSGEEVLVTAMPIGQKGVNWNIVAKINTKEALAAVKTLNLWMNVITVIAVIVILVVVYLFTRYIDNNLHLIVNRLKRTVEEIDGAANGMASASNQLAEGASQQAASIQDTSDELKELDSLSQKNAGDSKETNTMATTTSESAKKGSHVVEELVVAMENIVEGGNKIAGVAKSIENVAFQTNLLALNAAVEAARAGEAGAGFAVVSEEVRNLAQRVKESAQATTTIVETNKKLADEGISKVNNTKEALEEIITSVEKVAALINGISMASEDQAKGVDQIEKAISQMNNVVQANSANAEETSSASEQLSAQAASMKTLVEEFMVFIDGEKARRQDLSENMSKYETPAAASEKTTPRLAASEETFTLSDSEDFDF